MGDERLVWDRKQNFCECRDFCGFLGIHPAKVSYIKTPEPKYINKYIDTSAGIFEHINLFLILKK